MTVSCTTTHCSIQHTPDYSYKIAQDKLFHNNYTGAIQDLLNLQNLYLFSPYPQQIHLNLIYAYYKAQNLKLANESAQNFLILYPYSKNLDYVLYMHGIINMSLDRNLVPFFMKYSIIYWYNFTPYYANEAFYSFSKLIRKYPNSIYCTDAYKRLTILKNRIAEHELSIIKFYYKRNAYISVIIRSEKMLHYFPDTQATYKALYYMQQSYQNIRLLDQANNIHKIITENSIIY